MDAAPPSTFLRKNRTVRWCLQGLEDPKGQESVMPSFGVSPQKEAELLRRMAACGLHEADLSESFIRGSGSGGQKVNKTASCVQLTHRPTGLEVKVQEARSQALNRFFARRRLCELIEARTLGKASPEARRQEKLRKQKKRRKRRTSAGGATGDDGS